MFVKSQKKIGQETFPFPEYEYSFLRLYIKMKEITYLQLSILIIWRLEMRLIIFYLDKF